MDRDKFVNSISIRVLCQQLLTNIKLVLPSHLTQVCCVKITEALTFPSPLDPSLADETR